MMIIVTKIVYDDAGDDNDVIKKIITTISM